MSLICPKCGNNGLEDEITIVVEAWLTATPAENTDANDDGIWVTNTSIAEWGDESACRCGCGFEGVVAQFHRASREGEEV